MTVIFSIALLLLCLTEVTLEKASIGAVVTVFALRAITILGLGILALLSTGWLP